MPMRARTVVLAFVAFLLATPWVVASDSLGTIHGRVYEDVNANGRYDSGDTCVQSEITLLTDAGAKLQTARVSCFYGVYVFHSVKPGSYVLAVTQTTPAGYTLPSPQSITI